MNLQQLNNLSAAGLTPNQAAALMQLRQLQSCADTRARDATAAAVLAANVKATASPAQIQTLQLLVLQAQQKKQQQAAEQLRQQQQTQARVALLHLLAQQQQQAAAAANAEAAKARAPAPAMTAPVVAQPAASFSFSDIGVAKAAGSQRGPDTAPLTECWRCGEAGHRPDTCPGPADTPARDTDSDKAPTITIARAASPVPAVQRLSDWDAALRSNSSTPSSLKGGLNFGDLSGSDRADSVFSGLSEIASIPPLSEGEEGEGESKGNNLATIQGFDAQLQSVRDDSMVVADVISGLIDF